MGSNIEILKDWVDGKNFRPASINFVTDKLREEQARKVGDRWEDDNGKIWEKTTYGKKSIPKVLTALAESNPKCSACQKEIHHTHRHDNSAYRNTKMCFDCMIELDTQRRINGTYNDYATVFVLKKQKDYVIDMLEQLRSSYDSIGNKDVMEFINEFGDREQWSGLDTKKLKEELQKDINEGEEALKRINESLQLLDEQAKSKTDN